jgi:diguanylate cyclase (GGDEF)-like protein
MGHLREFVAQVLADHERTTSRLATEVAQFEGRVAELETLASTDPLTGIANRRSFETLLTKAIAAGQNISLLLYDLDEFKGINDRLGHEAGDQVLMHFARHLRNEIRANDLPARIGGDEFVALLFCPLEGALRRSQQILRGLERRHEVTCNGRTLGVPIRVSVGVVEHRAGESPAALLRRADEAMYEVKRHRSAGQR